MGKHPHTSLIEQLVELLREMVRQGMSYVDIMENTEQTLRDTVRERSAQPTKRSTD